ncbi:MAG: GldG family protein [Verrucomicrobiae bacterium]|nr:GldG family protein [Verrucomicrobiae bacterium]
MSEATSTPSASKRRLTIGANVLAQIVLAMALFAMINWLASRHYQRYDWTSTRYYALSEKTKQTLAALREPVDVVVFIPEGSQVEYVQKVLQDVRDLLKEFQLYARDKLRVEYVDPQRDLARARALVEKYKLDSPDVVIFSTGNRHKYVRLDEMVELEHAGFMMGGGQRVRAFKGEGEFLAAIQRVTEEEPPKVYFLTGHGERDPDNFDRQNGYSSIAQYIRRDNIEVLKWNLLQQQAMPTNAAAVIIAGPRTPYQSHELRELSRYLREGGRMMVLLDARQDSGLKSLLEEWQVSVGDDIVVASGGRLLGTELVLVEALGVDYGFHPIVNPLGGINTIFPYCRSVRRLTTTDRPAGPDAPRVTELVRTPPAFWAETNPDPEALEYTPNVDERGALSLAVAVETSRPAGVELSVAQTRLVVIGSSAMAANGTIGGAPGNLDFFMNTLNWLLQREQLIAVAPKRPQEFSLSMTPTQARTVYVLSIAGLPLAVAVLGLVVWIQRRK